MKKVWIAWGEHSCRKVFEIFDDKKAPDMTDVSFCEYEFDNEKELNAFLQGVSEAVGWMECSQIDDAKIAKKIRKAIDKV